MNKMKKTDLERFKEKYDINGNNGCWEWNASLRTNGYGSVWFKGKMRAAHRVSYELYVGEIPESESYHGTCVCHSCDNPKCVNPKHLFLGTQKENMVDMKAKNRGILPDGTGSLNPASKLNEKQIRIIKRILEVGRASYQEIADTFSVSSTTIHNINHNKSWKHV